jgi:hypothetical protein
MTTPLYPLYLAPIATTLCFAVFTVIWAFLFLKAYKEQQMRNAARDHPLTEPARQWERLDGVASSGAFSARGQENRSTDKRDAALDASHDVRRDETGSRAS